MVFDEATLDGKFLMFALGIGKADFTFLKYGDDSGMVLQQGERSHLAGYGDGRGFAVI